MSKRIKLSDQGKLWTRQNEHCFKRTVEVKIERQRILIVCEGTKTEPNYFKSIKRLLHKDVATIEIHGEGANTNTIVDVARKMRDKREEGDYPFDQVWVVFDCDSFPADQFDNAIRSAQAQGMKCA